MRRGETGSFMQGRNVRVIDGCLGEIPNSCLLEHVLDQHALDGLVLRGASGTVVSTKVQCAVTRIQSTDTFLGQMITLEWSGGKVVT